jgi:hypothetical protein
MLGMITILALAHPTGDPEPRYSAWVNDYHHLAIDCDFITHSFGRNAAWGLWRMPFGEVSWSLSEPGPDGDLILTLICPDGMACIQQGALNDTPERISRHEVPIKAERLTGDIDASLKAIDALCAAAEAAADAGLGPELP